jgi:hypothetical protein
VNFDADKKSQLLATSADDNKIYLWMRKFIPSACALSSMYGIYVGSGNWKTKLLLYGIGIPVGCCVGRLVVDHILFPGQQEKRLPYFVPIMGDE